MLNYTKNRQLSYNLFLFIFLKALLTQKEEIVYQKDFSDDIYVIIPLKVIRCFKAT